MWSNISPYFDKLPAQKKVAQLMLEYGIGVREGIPFCGNIRISFSALAESCGTDRRIVTSTLETICSEKYLSDIFSNITPTCSYKNLASVMGWGVLEILPDDVNRPGLISAVTGILAKKDINIRQIIADDPDISEKPKAFIITESRIPASLLQKIRDVEGIAAVVIY